LALLPSGKKRGKKEGQREGKREGKKEGEKTGVIKARVEVAQTMAARGYSPKEVAHATGLDIKTVKRLYRDKRA
jgi:predicted transposase YdaD